MLDEELETVNEYETPDRFNEDEHDYYELTAPSNDPENPASLKVFLAEKGDSTELKVKHETNIHYEPLFNIIEPFYPPRRKDELWIGDEDDYRERRVDSDWSTDSLNVFELYKQSGCWDFDVEWKYRNRSEDDSPPFDFELTVYDVFGPSMSRASFDPVEKILPVMLRDDAPAESRGGLMRDLMRIIGEDTEGLDVLATNYFDPRLIDEYVEDIAKKYDSGRKVI